MSDMLQYVVFGKIVAGEHGGNVAVGLLDLVPDAAAGNGDAPFAHRAEEFSLVLRDADILDVAQQVLAQVADAPVARDPGAERPDDAVG